jgi:hypothetical protein
VPVREDGESGCGGGGVTRGLTRVDGRAMRTRSEVDVYIGKITKLMARGKWRRGRSIVALAAKWGVPESTVRSWAGIASRLVHQDDAEDIAALKAMTVSRLLAIALRAEQDGALDSATKAWTALSAVTGLARTSSEVQRSERQLVEDVMRLAKKYPAVETELRELAERRQTAEREDDDD